MADEKKAKRTHKRTVAPFPIIIYTITAIWCALFLLIFLWGIVQSFKHPVNFLADPLWFPQKKYGGWRFSNYLTAFKNMQIYLPAKHREVSFLEMLYNTLFFCFAYSLVAVISPMLTSYVYAKYSKRCPWVKLIWIILLINLYVPLSASLGASLKLAMQLGYYDNMYYFLVVAMSGFNGNFLIYYATWKGLSWDFAEAAMIDGANPWKIFFKIMFPMTINIFVVLFVTQFIGYWSDYQTPMVFLPSHPTLAYGVYRFQTSIVDGASEPPIKIAALIAVAVPMFALFMVFRKKMMNSLTVGGLKG